MRKQRKKIKNFNLMAGGGGMAIAEGATNILSNVVASTGKAKQQANSIISSMKENTGKAVNIMSSVNTTQDALNAAQMGENQVKDLDAYGAGNYISNTLSGAKAGMSAGGPWGAAIGAVAGIGASLFGNWQRNRQNNRVKEETATQNVILSSNRNNMYSKVDDIQNNLAMANYAALGGNLFNSGGQFTNGVTEFMNGGTHEQNPNMGIPQGVDQNGTPNLVEEGELKYNNYVFSNRLKPNKILLKGVNLPDRYNKKTYANIAKRLSIESNERPNDIISKNGLDSMLGRLKESQEVYKTLLDENDYRKTKESNMLGNGGFYWSARSRAYSSLIYDKKGNLIGDKNKIYNKINNIRPYRYDNMKTPYEIEESIKYEKNPLYNYPKVLTNPTSSSFQYRNQGNLIGDKNTTTIDINNPITKKTRIKRSNNSMLNTPPITYTNKKNKIIDPINRNINTNIENINKNFKDPYFNSRDNSINYLEKGIKTNIDKAIYNNKLKTINKYNKDKKFQDISNGLMRAAPIIGDLTSMMNGVDADYHNAESIGTSYNPVSPKPIGNYLTYKPMDTQFAINKLQGISSSSRDNLINQSGGNRATATGSILANDYNLMENVGNTLRQADEYNNAQNERVTGFNRETNMYNSEAGLKAGLTNSKYLMDATIQASLLREGIDAQASEVRSKMLSNFFNNLGKMGEDIWSSKRIDELIESGALQNPKKNK